MNYHSRMLPSMVLLSLILASCGGGSGGGGGGGLKTDSETLILKKFVDNYGVLRFSESQSKPGSRSWLYIQPNVERWKRGADAGAEDEDTPFDPISFKRDLNVKLQNGSSYYSGTLSYRDRGIADARGFVSSDQKERVLYLGNSEFTTIFVFGERVSSIPTGSQEYEGIISSGLKKNFSASDFQYTEFRMSVDFSQETGSIQGTDESQFPVLDGEFTVDLKNGFFRGDNLDLNISPNVNSNASLYGTFHGNRAKGVTGVFHNSESIPTYIGMLMGSRIEQ